MKLIDRVARSGKEITGLMISVYMYRLTTHLRNRRIKLFMMILAVDLVPDDHLLCILG